MSGSTDAFSFEHADRTYTCSVDSARLVGGDRWWWFTVSTEVHQRHAPFPAVEGDTRDSVRARIIDYHETRLARRAEPHQSRWQQRGSAARAAAPAAPAARGTAATG